MDGDKRVVIIDEKQQTREALAALVNDADGFQCSGTFDSIETALQKINAQNTDLVLVDIGVTGLSRIKNLSFLVLPVYEDDDRIFEALCAGASGYLLKKTSPAQLLEGLREAMNGGSPMSPEIAARILAFFHKIHLSQDSEYQLTLQEMRLLNLMVEGHNHKTAATELGVSMDMISFVVKRIYGKLQNLSRLVSR